MWPEARPVLVDPISRRKSSTALSMRPFNCAEDSLNAGKLAIVGCAMIAPLAGLKADDYKRSRFRPRQRRSGSVTFGHAVYLKNMRKLVLVIALACLAAISLGGRAHAQTQKARVPVVLELFTSEGCSDCPPADALLGQLASQSPAGTEIIPLGFHVDYWDELGWHDRFSSRQFSWRQDQYRAKFETDSVYTPQMVVNGRFETVGSSSAKILNAIA